MKAYTDLEQSKKLAEILPLESADMFWRYNHNIHTYDAIPKILVVNNWDDDYNKDIPCWSLAALLGLLPKRIEIVDNVYELSIYLYGIYYWNIINGNLCFESKDKDNLVDACHEAIVFLHEQKLSLYRMNKK